MNFYMCMLHNFLCSIKNVTVTAISNLMNNPTFRSLETKFLTNVLKIFVSKVLIIVTKNIDTKIY